MRAPFKAGVMLVEDGQYFSSLALDLGPKGMRVLTCHPLPAGSHLTARFTLPGEGHWEVSCRVVRQEGYGSGRVQLTDLAFESLDASHTDALSSWAREHETAPAAPVDETPPA